MTLAEIIERVVAGRWLAGTQIRDAINTARKFNKYGIEASINYLGRP